MMIVIAFTRDVNQARLVQARVVGFEMAREPGIEPRAKLALATSCSSKSSMMSQWISSSRALVIGLALSDLIVTALAHESLLQRKMRRCR